MCSLRDELIDIVSGLAEEDLVNALNDTGLGEIFYIEDGDLEYMREESVHYTDVDFSDIKEEDLYFCIDKQRKAHSFCVLCDNDYKALADYMLSYSDSLGFDEVAEFFISHNITERHLHLIRWCDDNEVELVDDWGLSVYSHEKMKGRLRTAYKYLGRATADDIYKYATPDTRALYNL